jgi:hypothetical protein
MELVMYLGNDLIEGVKLNDNMLSKPGYLGNIKRCLKTKHQELVQESGQNPEFLLAQVHTSKTSMQPC